VSPCRRADTADGRAGSPGRLARQERPGGARPLAALTALSQAGTVRLARPSRHAAGCHPAGPTLDSPFWYSGRLAGRYRLQACARPARSRTSRLGQILQTAESVRRCGPGAHIRARASRHAALGAKSARLQRLPRRGGRAGGVVGSPERPRRRGLRAPARAAARHPHGAGWPEPVWPSPPLLCRDRTVAEMANPARRHGCSFCLPSSSIRSARRFPGHEALSSRPIRVRPTAL
jgi:hypothetical protein